ncbi:MAG: protein-glutamine gamma-glutamyltransferase [Acidobacteriota bacterium]|jgi:transglutaminase-like putative cysteine protease|nr:protein-glutamine gamma-glutamyltransferase [Acidobacteriota bacterium]
MTFNTFFRVSSYAMVGCGALALAVSDGLSGMLFLAFAVVLGLAWKLEGTKWQLPERVGLFVVLLSLPLFYLDWQFLSGGAASEKVGVSALGHLILFLSAVKLLQVKADRDWVFLYLISFFEVLLAAGLSLSPLFLLTLALYALFALSTVLAFEIRKARRSVKIAETRLLVASDSTLFRRLRKRTAHVRDGEARRLPLVSLFLMLLIFALALPLFLIVPRTGANALARAGEGGTGFVGFSDSVTLGDVGRLQQSDRLVMRVRVEDVQPESSKKLRWRGVALDFFNGRGWQRTDDRLDLKRPNNERGFFQLGTTEDLQRLTTQTFYVEPIDTPILFAAPRVVALQGAIPYLRRDTEDALSTRPHYQERISYKVYSDIEEPDEESLRRTTLGNARFYPAAIARYLQLPGKIDPRIPRLAQEWITTAGATNQYDAARAIEERLQRDFGYTLDLKATGTDPLADFLFNVREGHCEYFSTAMAVMLRTQGIPARVVNGFQRGEYNGAAGVYTVTQREAHSWVEVYFPETDAWVTFDPTPMVGRPTSTRTGIKGWFSKYAEALEMLWIQYVVGYDSQEQRSLAKSFGNRFYDFRSWVADKFKSLKETFAGWFSWLRIENEDGTVSYTRLILLILFSILTAIGLVLLVKRIRRLGFWRIFRRRQVENERNSAVEFYERMTKTLAARGLARAAGETPLEFAAALRMPEALKITKAYNRVRFGDEKLSVAESKQIEEWLSGMEGEQF